MSPAAERWDEENGSVAPPRVRRSMCLDATRTHLLGPVRISGRVCDDVWSGRTTEQRRSEVSQLEAAIDFLPDRRIAALQTTPPVAGLERLVGEQATSGFRKQLSAVCSPTVGRNGAMALLEELPNVTMLSRVPIMVAGVPDDIEGMRRAPHVDVCAGWVEGGELALRPPDVLPQRYPFKLETAAEEGAWSELPELPPISFRRFRTIEVQAGTEAGVFEVRSAFSDVVSEPSGKLTLLHSYGVDAVVDAERRLSSCIARPRALPTGDCLGAATSTGRLIGVSLDDVYRRVRHEFRGTTTCTHLNEQLRALADVSHLLDIMAYDS